MQHEKIQDRALGRWRDILLGVGVPSSALTGKHGPCPICNSGRDKFRWDDRNGSGSFFCNFCGAGGGVDFVMKFLRCDFITAKAEIEKHIGSAKVHVPKAVDVGDMQGRMIASWQRAQPLGASDAAARYLRARGLDLDPWPSQLRYAAEAAYKHDDGKKSFHPAMVAKFVGPDGKMFTLHRTFLDDRGRKADLPEVRKLAPGKSPEGGAVRLAPSAETMGVSTGIETSLSASIMWRVPVWATLNDRLLLKWEPPPTARRILIFGDNDASFSGQMAAYGLAYRLRNMQTDGVHKYEIEIHIPEKIGDDWNDVHRRDLGLNQQKETQDEYAGIDF